MMAGHGGKEGTGRDWILKETRNWSYDGWFLVSWIICIFFLLSNIASKIVMVINRMKWQWHCHIDNTILGNHTSDMKF